MCLPFVMIDLLHFVLLMKWIVAVLVDFVAVLIQPKIVMDYRSIDLMPVYEFVVTFDLLAVLIVDAVVIIIYLHLVIMLIKYHLQSHYC